MAINCTSVLNPIPNTNLSTPITIHKVQNEFWYCNVNKYRIDRQFYTSLLIYTSKYNEHVLIK